MGYQIIFSEELYHHGIAGQKWGKRNGPPYPLDQSDHSAAEKKAEQEKQKGFHLTDKQKKIALYVLATAAIAGVSVYAVNDPNVRSAIAKGMDYVNGQGDRKIDFESLGPKITDKNGNELSEDALEKALEKINQVKTLNPIDPEGKLKKADIAGDLKEALNGVNPSNEKDHCQQNSLAACLKYMGFDVNTKSGILDNTPGAIVDKCFKGSFENKVKEPNLKFDSAEKASEFIKNRLKAVNGSCGTISTRFKTGVDGHAIMWAMEDDKIKFCDPWARTVSGGFRVVDDASFYFGSVFSGEHPVVSRIDNLELNYDEFFKYFDSK